MKVVSFIPIKLNNQRLPGKNTMMLNGRPMCDYLFETISEVDTIDEKYIYCSDEAIKPYIIGNEAPALDGKPHPSKELQVSRTKQTPAQLEKYRQFSMCINCGLCYAACPQFGLNPEFLGPAAITMAHRYNLDNRDHGKAQRMPLLNGKNGVWSCTFVGYCSEVCPKHVDPASAINQGKVESAKDYVISMLKPKG